MLGRLDDAGRHGGGEAGADGAVGSVSHEAVEEGPRWTEDLGRRPEGRLLECHVGLLRLVGCLELAG